MAPELLKVDPNGDTLLILHYSDAPFAVDGPFELWPIALSPCWAPGQLRNETDLIISAVFAADAPFRTSEIQMQLSSKHLRLASIYFQRLMSNDWKETQAGLGYIFTVTAKDFDPEALIILMNIIHGQTQKAPKTVGVEMLAKIAVLVDYSQCHRAVHYFAESWISRLRQPPDLLSYGRDLLLRLFVSYVFSDHDAFTKITKTIIFESRGPIHTLGLPIPKELVGSDALESSRQQRISDFISSLNSWKVQLAEKDNACSFDCASMSLGALIKGMKTMHLYDPQPTKPFDGYCVLALVKSLGRIRTPGYRHLFRHSPNSHCSFEEKIQSLIRMQLAGIHGLQLGSFACEV